MWQVRYHPEAEDELGKLPATEQTAVRNAVEKLQAIGLALGSPTPAR
jgi:mRNA-degrading endonuclease RelE of RelBE toxin-antitoxin system